MTQFVLSPSAANDLDQIFAHLLEHGSAQVALDAQRRFADAFRRLAQYPDAGRSREDLADEPVRTYVVYSYVIVYRPVTPLEVIRVIHGARDLPRLFEED